MDLDPRRLTVLGAVARAGGILSAAELLHVTPPAVSQQIARLERDVGISLLDRGARGVTLTAAGRILADTAERIEAELLHARRELAAVTGRVAGRVVVAAFPTAIRHVVAPAVTELAVTSPGITTRVVELDGPPAMSELRSGGVDVLVMDRDARAPRAVGGKPSDGSTPRGLHDVPLLDEPWRVVVPPTAEIPRDVADLVHARWVVGPKDSTARLALERIGRSHGWQLSGDHECLEYPAVLALVSAGLGCALVPALALADRVPEVRVAALAGLGQRRLVLRHRATRNEPAPAVRTVVNSLVVRARQVTLP